jgi:hypothetical protein
MSPRLKLLLIAIGVWLFSIATAIVLARFGFGGSDSAMLPMAFVSGFLAGCLVRCFSRSWVDSGLIVAWISLGFILGGLWRFYKRHDEDLFVACLWGGIAAANLIAYCVALKSSAGQVERPT